MSWQSFRRTWFLAFRVWWVGMGFFNMSNPNDISYLRFVYNRGVTLEMNTEAYTELFFWTVSVFNGENLFNTHFKVILILMIPVWLLIDDHSRSFIKNLQRASPNYYYFLKSSHFLRKKRFPVPVGVKLIVMRLTWSFYDDYSLSVIGSI